MPEPKMNVFLKKNPVPCKWRIPSDSRIVNSLHVSSFDWGPKIDPILYAQTAHTAAVTLIQRLGSALNLYKQS